MDSDNEDKSESKSVNPYYDDVLQDISDRSAWAKTDAEIMKRRMAERKSKKTKPYKGAPNGVVPIVDDVTREVTNQNITMIMNAPLMAHIIPLGPMDADMKSKAERAFDTYLRYVIRARPKMEEADDTKTARGYAVMKVFRTEHPRFGAVADFDTRDPRDIIVPSNTKDIQSAERIVDVLRFTKRELRDKVEKGWDAGAIEELIKSAKADESGAPSGSSEDSTLETTKHLIGLTTSGKNTKTIVVWEEWCYANQWIADKNSEIKKGKKCCILYSPDKPELVLHSYPWKEDDVYQPLGPEELAAEILLAEMEQREVMPEKLVEVGKDRAWPFVQPRFEYRSRYYYDSRGVGHLCMDDQIYATGIFNAKMTWMDYLSNPMFEGDEPENSSNFTAEPGAKLPRSWKIADLPSIPSALDFGIDYHRRAAGQRAGAGSMYSFSEQVSQSRKLEKTATEVQYDQARTAQVSSAAVDRFNDPWQELFQQLWDELRRMQKPLPMIRNNEYQGEAPLDVYKTPVMLVPAASAKTLNPDIQFSRSQSAYQFVAAMAGSGAVAADLHKGMRAVLDNYDPFFADQILLNPNGQGPQGQPPIYNMLRGLQQAVQQLAGMIDQSAMELKDVQKLAIEHDDTLLKQTKVKDVVPEDSGPDEPRQAPRII